MKVLVGGTRYWQELTILLHVVNLLPPTVTVMHGANGNVDKLFGRYASERGLTVEPHPAQWGLYGKAAGPRRNQEMINEAGFVILFWDAVSRGTKDTLKRARKAGLPGRIIYSTPTARILGVRMERL